MVVSSMDTTEAKYVPEFKSVPFFNIRSRIAAFLLFIAVVLATHLPTAPLTFSADDYLLRAMLLGDAALADIGFTNADPDRSVAARISDTFHFFSTPSGSLETQRYYGNLPWWSVTEGLMRPFRPLAAITHWIDYQLWPNDRVLMQVQSLLYFVLFAIAGLVLYQRLTSDWAVVVLAAAFLVFDVSMALNFSWLAARNTYLSAALGMLSIRCYMQWRDEARWRYWWGAAMGFLAALLTAEAGLAVAGYFGAYALVYDARGWKKGLISLLPFVAIVVVWRAYYNAMEFGALNIGLYLDPGRDMVGMIERVITVFPHIVVSLATGVDGLIGGVDLTYRFWLSLVCWLLVGVFVYLVGDLLKHHREARFMFLGSAFATIPHCSLLSGGNRNGTFVAIGFFFILALWCARLLQKNNTFKRRLFGAGLLALHLVLPVLLQAGTTWNLIPVTFTGRVTYPIAASPAAVTQSAFVYVNADSTNLMYYLPYEWSSDGKPLPKQMQVLAPGLSSVYLRRKSARVLELTSPGGFVLHQDSEILREDLQPAPAISSVHGKRILSGLVTSPEGDFSQGRVFSAAGMKVTVLDVKSKRITRIRIEMEDDEPLEHKQWMAFDWKSNSYISIPPPTIGQTLYFPGPLDI